MNQKENRNKKTGMKQIADRNKKAMMNKKSGMDHDENRGKKIRMDQKTGSRLKKAFAWFLTGILCLSAAAPVMAAAEDTIDMSATGSLTVHKYDLTAAASAGVDPSVYKASGEKDPDAERALASYAVEGVEFTYLKVSDIVTDSQNGHVVVVYAVEPRLRNILSLETANAAVVKDGSFYYTMQQLNSAIGRLLSNNTAGKNQLEDYIKISGGTPMPLTDAEGVTGAGNLALGLYLVVETKVPENVFYTCDPFFVSVPSTDATGDYWFYDIDIYPKNQTSNPLLDKKVKSDETDAVYADTATVSGGETVSYIFVSKLPAITSKASYLSVYTFTDKMSKGLEYNKDAVIYFYTDAAAANQNRTEAAVAKWALTGGSKDKFSVSYTGGASDPSGSGMTIKMTDAGLAEINPARSAQYMVVAYTAQVMSGDALVLGDTGNPNDVKLEWQRKAASYLDTMEDEAVVYAFGMDITKTFSNDKGDFSQVAFVIRNTTDGHYLTATGARGLYCAEGKAASEEAATKFVPDEKGKLVIRELEADRYMMTEIRTAPGFGLLKDEITVDISGTSKNIIASEAEITGTPNYTNAADYYAAQGSRVRKFVEIIENSGASSQVDKTDAQMHSDRDSQNALVAINILNNANPVLPKTGGSGLYAVTIIGMIAFAAGMFIIIRGRKKVNV